ncbi:hypothetical protein K469DRAFT_483410, partial [Zopfia rhizophila CBS 207.26]
ITKKQKKFIRKWLNDFAKDQGHGFLAREEINALATLVKGHPRPVEEYINRKLMNFAINPSSGGLAMTGSQMPSARTEIPSQSRYSLTEANSHLPQETLRLVDKYVRGYQRQRTRNDGRRTVNNGPYKCTYACGYRTKRAFDWRRHEETHEPQELWLCHFCNAKGEQNPFLVNRKDKFLKHAKDVHKQYEPETVLDMSKVDFHANFDPKCPMCPELSSSWDERCKHILQHYDDDDNSSRSRRLGRGGRVMRARRVRRNSSIMG